MLVHRRIGLAKTEIMEVFFGDDAVFDTFIGLGENVRHIRHVEMANVGTKNRIDPRTVWIHIALERPGICRIISFTAKSKN